MNPGFYTMSKEAYLSDPCPEPSLSSSIAHLAVSETLAHAWAAHPKGGKTRRDPSRAMLDSNVLDSLLLGGDTELVHLPEELPDAKGVFVPTNDKALLKSAKDWKAEQEAAGRQVISRDDLFFAKRAAEAILENLASEGIFLKGKHQQTVIWQEHNGVWVRNRLDHWIDEENEAFDVKCVRSAHPRAVASMMWEFGYDIQNHCYVKGLESVTGRHGRIRKRLLFCEKEPPHAVYVGEPDGTFKAIGKWRWEKAVRLWGECLEARSWPSYKSGPIAAPHYAVAEMEAETLSGGSDGLTF